MNRRSFVQWAGLSWVMSVVLAACRQSASNTDAETGTDTSAAPGASGLVEVGAVSELDQGAIQAEIEGRQVIVIRDPNQPDQLIALDAVCPHAGCAVDWQAESEMFVCPCHNSQFAASGDVTQGPATSGLEPLTAQIEGDAVLVQVS
ncbi:MAG: Rieske (2Fe-2S) protein [Kaiparowitsia implicata GSE-PSE-MK54-09C]|nr:Rieske (2Fe-2S) protein [Kaiparowitsia implicata GSE-PSE-MK54-09C]